MQVPNAYVVIKFVAEKNDNHLGSKPIKAKGPSFGRALLTDRFLKKTMKGSQLQKKKSRQTSTPVVVIAVHYSAQQLKWLSLRFDLFSVCRTYF